MLKSDLPIYHPGANIKQLSAEKKHILSHQIIYAKMIYVEVIPNFSIPSQIIRVNKKDIYKFAVSLLVEQFLHEAGLGI